MEELNEYTDHKNYHFGAEKELFFHEFPKAR